MNLTITSSQLTFPNKAKELKINNSFTHRNNSVAFKGQSINGHYYTDREYLDALDYKDSGGVSADTFMDRYGFFKYIFTSKAERHAEEVNKCIADLKAVEEQEANARSERLYRQALAEARVQRALEEARAETLRREQAIQEAKKIQENKGLARCKLSQALKDELVEKIVNLFAVDSLNKQGGWKTEVPNAVLLYSSNSRKNRQVAKVLGEQILQDKFSDNFYTVSLKNGNHNKFEEGLNKAKRDAAAKYKETGQRAIIFIPDFDKIAVDYDTPSYNPKLNSFLKTFLLDCANNGCTIFATAQDIKKIEEPFVINKQRFSIKIHL